VKTDSLSKNQLVVRTKCSFCGHLIETFVKTKKRRKVFLKPKCKSWISDFKDSNSLITSLCIEYIGEFMALTQNGPMPVFL